MSSETSPPRYWWLKRLTLGYVLVLVGWAVLHGLLTWHAAAAERRLLAEWKTDGGPYPDLAADPDLSPPEFDGNAAALLYRAIASTPTRTVEQQSAEAAINGWNVPEATGAARVAAIRTLASGYDEQLALLRQARQAPDAVYDWGNRIGIPGRVQVLNDNRTLGIIVGWNLQLALLEQDVERFAALGLDLVTYAEGGIGQVPLPIGVGVAATNFGTVARKLPEAARDETLDDEAWLTAAPELHQLIQALLAYDFVKQNAVSWRNARAELALEHLGQNVPNDGMVVSHLFTPMHRLGTVAGLREIDRLADEFDSAAAEASPHTALQRLSRRDSFDNATSVGGFLSQAAAQTFLPQYEHTISFLMHTIVNREVAAAAAAVRLYAAEHDGELPARLDVLVPDYLPRLPQDPYASDGLLRYRTDTPLPVIYSVGDDRIDGIGDTARSPRTGSSGGPAGSPYFGNDFVFPLRASPVADMDPWAYLYHERTKPRPSAGE
jgi:hypothetical protein